MKWIWKDADGKSPVEQIIAKRGYDDTSFNVTLEDLPDDALMKDIEKAAQRIIQAIRDKECIIIYGDDDPDGITSTYILFDYLEKLGSQNHFYHVPNRLVDHHGIQEGFVQKARDLGVNLVITVDGCSSSFEGVQALNELGIETIITDHHLVQDELPKAYAIVNPKQADCQYPYPMLAGVGVTWLLIRHISKICGVKPDPSYLFWTMVGTVADKAPLDGVNRIICLEVLRSWRAVFDDTAQFLSQYYYTPEDNRSKMNFIAFAYKILSSGRMLDGENRGMRLLLANPVEKRDQLKRLFMEKSEYERKINAVIDIVSQIEPTGYYFIYFDESDKIPFALYGLAASIVTSRFKIPVIFLKKKKGLVVGEARSTDAINLIDSFNHCSDILVQYGGHARAAGFTLEEDRLPEFEECFGGFLRDRITEIEDAQKIEIDAVLRPFDINEQMFEKLNEFQPFGQGNLEPIFLVKRMTREFMDQTGLLFSGKNALDPYIEYDIVIQLRNDGNMVILDYKLCIE